MTTPSHPFTPSTEQSLFFSWIATGTGNTMVRAVAGSGKTTTIVESLKYIDPSKTVLFLAFNKSIATELKERVPSNVTASTFHSLGLNALGKLPGKRAKIDNWKVSNILRKLLPDKREYDLYDQFVKRLVSFAKGALGLGILEPSEQKTWLTVAKSNDMFLDEDEGASYEKGVALAMQCFTFSNGDSTLIDFDDMLYLPLLHRAPFSRFDFVFIDEAQDTNAVQRAMVTKCCTPSTRLIAVGDESQAIYAFRGADHSAMQLLSEKFSCQSHELSVSYRCSQAVVQEARKYQTVH